MNAKTKQVDAPRGASPVGNKGSDLDPALPDRRVREDGSIADSSQRRRPGETPRDKPVEEEADKDVKHGGT